MFRKLLILGAIAALFTIVTVVPASAIAVKTGPGHPTGTQTAQTVLNPENLDGTSNDAHGPICGALGDCAHNGSGVGLLSPSGLASNPMPGDGGFNLGAWNAVFQSDDASAICGIVEDDDSCE
jgi:hypothetical protein